MQPAARDSPIERIQRAVRRHILRAQRALRQPRLDDKAIHDARKDLKRARSGLRLLRPLDEGTYRRENTRLRNAARQLSGVRDHKVLLARIAELLAEEKKPERRRLFLHLRKDLYNARRRDWRRLRSATELEHLETLLANAAKSVQHWPAPAQVDADSAPAIAVRRLYRKGRKALERSRADPSDECLHEARKQAKHLAQALKILAGEPDSKTAKKVLGRAADIDDYLGDDHDLAVVESQVLRLPAVSDKPKQKLRSRLEAERARLQKKALAAGRKLFRKKAWRALRREATRATQAGVSGPS